MEPLISDQELNRKCLDDGSIFVNIDGTVYTANSDSPNLDDIVQYIKALPASVGVQVQVAEISQEVVDSIHELMTQSDSLSANDQKKSELEQKLESLCQAGVNSEASDIHTEIHRNTTRFLLRVDGKRELLTHFSDGQSARHQTKDLGISLISYVFSTLGRQDIKLRDPANDSFSLMLDCAGTKKMVEWRAALIPLDRGVKLTLRCLTPRNKALTLDDMDLPPTYLALLKKIIARRQGAIVITGPMGSGKSSLVNALIATIDRIARCAHGLEDPVEFELDYVCKTPVEPTKETEKGSGVFRDYAFYCKETLRHDVDVSLLGELRDYPAAKEFCRKAETGGLAITTLHTNSALSVPQTFIQQLGIPAAIVGAPDLMALFIHQKLIRRLCPHCALSLPDSDNPDDPTRQLYIQSEQADTLDQKITLLHSQVKEDKHGDIRIRHPSGCEKCGGKGEKGRTVVMEIIVLDDTDRRFISREDDHGWKQHLLDLGWPDIREHTLSRIQCGQVDILSAAEQIDGLVPIVVKDTYTAMRDSL